MKFGIKDQYPRIAGINVKLAAYFALVRPFSLIAPFVVGMLGVLIERQYNQGTILFSFDLFFTLVYVGLTIALLQAVGQVTNQATDIHIDKWNKPYRPIPKGRVTKEEAYAIAFILAIFALARAVTISFPFFVFCVFILIFSVGYSVDPVRIKEKAVYISLPWLALSRGLMPLLATWTVFGKVIDSAFPWALGIVATMWVLAFQASKDFGDEFGDREFNVPTLVTYYGKQNALRIMVVLATFYPIAILYFISVGALPSGLYILLILIPVEILILFFIRNNIESKLENNLGWVLFYIGLGLISILGLVGLMIS